MKWLDRTRRRGNLSVGPVLLAESVGDGLERGIDGVSYDSPIKNPGLIESASSHGFNDELKKY
jgi:hypothetical protein